MNESADADADITARRTAGQTLLAARQENNITIEYVSQELRLSAKLIEAIEADQAEGLPESTYVRGYIRSYARLLGLDEDDVLERYVATPEATDEWASKIPGSASEGLVKQRKKSRRASPFSFAALVVIIGFLAWFAWDQDWFQLRQNESVTRVTEVAPVNTNSISATEAARAAMNIASQPSPPLIASVDSGTVAATSMPDTPTLPPLDEEVELTFEFNDTSWVDVRDRNDSRLMFRSYTSGEFERVIGLRPFRIFIGNAAAVQMTYAGQPYDLLAHRNGMYAKFELGQVVDSTDEGEAGQAASPTDGP
jgi:cytoskeleton protein RodZ